MRVQLPPNPPIFMKWNTSVKKKLLGNKLLHSDSGCSCVFIKINDKIGLKVYGSLRARNYAYKWQAKAHKAKVGPAVGEKISIFDTKHPITKAINRYTRRSWCTEAAPYYCYITQVVKIPGSGISHKQLMSIKKKLRKIKFATRDVETWHNTGLLDGRPVCYDFDPATGNADSVS